MIIVYLYIAFAYGYGLALCSEINEDLTVEYWYDIKEYKKASAACACLFIIFPLIWPFVIIYNLFNKED